MNNLNGRYWSILFVIVLFLAILMEVSAAPLRNKLIGKVFTGSIEEKRAMRLEQYRDEINFCLKNLGKRFDITNDELRRKLNGRSLISYELVAEKYDWYGDKAKQAEYYYKDWLEFNKTEKKRIGGNNVSLENAVGVWKEAGLYAKALAHYEELYKYTFGNYGEGLELEKKLNTDLELRQYYGEFIKEWDKIKKLAKTESPKPLEPAVQHHEWFYSDKQEEVLKALEYYHANKVNFMLEKALKHKDPVIAAKAKEYLDSLAKGAGDETKH